jgi:hypothetical protein
MASKCTLHLQLFKMGATRGTVVETTSLALSSRFVKIIAASIVMSRRARRQALPVLRRSKHLFHVCWLRSNAPCSSTSAPDVATANNGTSSSHAAAATGSATLSNSAPVSHKSDTAKSSSSASPSQSVKANSVARDISSGAIAGIMFAVGLTSVLVTLVV